MIDQLNNSIGREIAINSPTANNKELAYMILDHFAKVGLYQAERSDSNLYNVVRKHHEQNHPLYRAPFARQQCTLDAGRMRCGLRYRGAGLPAAQRGGLFGHQPDGQSARPYARRASDYRAARHPHLSGRAFPRKTADPGCWHARARAILPLAVVWHAT